MQDSLRKSWPARLSALGFILVVLLGNVWLTFGLTKEPIPTWLGIGMAVAIGLTLLGGVGLVALIAWRKLRAPEL